MNKKWIEPRLTSFDWQAGYSPLASPGKLFMNNRTLVLWASEIVLVLEFLHPSPGLDPLLLSESRLLFFSWLTPEYWGNTASDRFFVHLSYFSLALFLCVSELTFINVFTQTPIPPPHTHTYLVFWLDAILIWNNVPYKFWGYSRKQFSCCFWSWNGKGW